MQHRAPAHVVGTRVSTATHVTASAATTRPASTAPTRTGARSVALSQITENRKVWTRKLLIFQYTIFGFCLERQFWVVALNARDGTHPNLETGARLRAVDPGLLPRRGRTTMRWLSTDRSGLPPSRGSQGATCVAHRPLVWVPVSARVLVIACGEAPDDKRPSDTHSCFSNHMRSLEKACVRRVRRRLLWRCVRLSRSTKLVCTV